MDRNQGDGYCSQHHVGLRSKRREEGGQVQEILPKRIVHMSMDDTLKQELLLAAQRRLQRVGLLNRKSHMSQGKQVLGLPPPPPPIIRTRRSFPAPHT
ncbi:unnamed protein product, partial [Notodromas monacha]